MPKISSKKEEKIKEAILSLLFQTSPKALFTAKIAQELARDEEYIKKMLLEMEQRNFIVAIRKNAKGADYKRRIKWRLDSKVYEAYKRLDETNRKFIVDSRIL
ncbi:MAG: hypothetical protein QW622_03295 [Candidatus Pacearchaeota archaeon]